MTRKALVTGASSGIGRATAAALQAEGYRVIGTARRPELIEQLAHVDYRALDLHDADSIARLAPDLASVDVLSNKAGESQSGPLEEIPLQAIEHLFRLNVFGAIRLTQLALPGMRSRRYGRVVMVGSMLASFPLAYRSSYVASKAAIKAFAESARLELSPFNVWLTTVEPGSVHTGISERRINYIGEESVHRADFERMLNALNSNERRAIGADKVAATIVEAVQAAVPKAFYAVGSQAPLAFALRRFLPQTMIAKITARKHGLKR